MSSFLTDPEVRTVPAVDGVPIVYELHGSEADGPALVLIHGWSNSREVWADHVGPLSRSYPVIALDLPGFGDSGTQRTDWSMETYAADVATVLRDAQVGPAILVGYSMGAVVALEAAASSSDQALGVVLVDMLQMPGVTMSDAEFQAYGDDIRQGWGKPDWVRRAGFSEAASPTLVDRYLASAPKTIPSHWWPSFRDTRRWMGEDAIPTLEHLPVPLAAINSDRIPTDVATFRRYVPSFAVRIISGVGHLGTLWEDPDAFRGHLKDLVDEMAPPS